MTNRLSNKTFFTTSRAIGKCSRALELRGVPNSSNFPLLLFDTMAHKLGSYQTKSPLPSLRHPLNTRDNGQQEYKHKIIAESPIVIEVFRESWKYPKEVGHSKVVHQDHHHPFIQVRTKEVDQEVRDY